MSEPNDPRLEGDDAFEDELDRATVLRLRGEDPRADRWQPEDQDLVQFARNPRALAPELRARIDAYLEKHPAERDALAAFEVLAPAPPVAEAAEAPSLLARLTSSLAALVPAPRAVASAAALFLVAGVGFLLTQEPDEPVWRGPDTPIEDPIGGPDTGHPPLDLAEIELVPGVVMPLEAASLPTAGEVLLILVLPGEPPEAPVELTLLREGAAEPLAQRSAPASEGPAPAVQLRVPAEDLEPGAYRVEVFEGPAVPPVEFLFEVR